ncbi:MAG TPA: c-type cytochrome, partial [Acetobacteraceae bacterium]|nr:c-type cytochrome [Acetobacteraceae bacterium]
DAARLPPWWVPDLAVLPQDDYGRAVRYGGDLILHTSALIGPDAPATAMRFAGNGLECQNCHLDGGTARFGLPLVGIWNLYPAFSARLDAIQTMADRINDCMARSMNGRPLPLDGPEIKAIEAYIRFLGSDQTTNVPLVGRGAPALPLPNRAADPVHGAEVYQVMCAACHQADGAGVRYSLFDSQTKKQRYLFPPLWGPDSFNDAAGMSRNITAAWFVHANMPRGITFAYPQLEVNDSYDVAAFINEQPRPHKSGLERDYPDPWLKPADAAYPPLLGPFPSRQHELGPWQPIDDWLRHNMPENRHGPHAGGDLEAVIGLRTAPSN